jgi:hypothetical protein
VARPGLAREGLQVYRASGCAYCHSEQVRQGGTVCDVLLTDAGTNQAAVIAALAGATFAGAAVGSAVAGPDPDVCNYTDRGGILVHMSRK